MQVGLKHLKGGQLRLPHVHRTWDHFCASLLINVCVWSRIWSGTSFHCKLEGKLWRREHNPIYISSLEATGIYPKDPDHRKGPNWFVPICHPHVWGDMTNTFLLKIRKLRHGGEGQPAKATQPGNASSKIQNIPFTCSAKAKCICHSFFIMKN